MARGLDGLTVLLLEEDGKSCGIGAGIGERNDRWIVYFVPIAVPNILARLYSYLSQLLHLFFCYPSHSHTTR